ncbi:MAG TPA: tetratricopeptide repeat protein [Syntrophales bacterium]|nr:tetratricopeptide repeat protein [Syntrophales bacterium]HOM07526.1 tetratricopeptide repeat protein [Syntrophales bacterium]HON99853.1 tetratricopeptide repeat protein [Syntrophales bacterium]HPC01430.1 tetratricopeptide repeat protein [Syntrophales bacterium]HPQ07129.1 tetratricopeptide repeat protein [Syntrophales bacterium]
MRTFRTPFLAVLLFYLFLKPVFAGDLAYAVQVGAFVKENNALALTDKLTKAGYMVTVREEPAAEGERTLRKVLVGPYETRSEAMRAGRDLKQKGFAAGHPILRVLPTPEAGVEKPRELAQAKTAATDVSPAETVKAEPKPPAAPSPPSTGGIEAALKEGIRQYRDENYEEAIEVLAQARRQDPKSSTAAFFLGLAYKQTNDFTQAAAQMRDAVTLTPPIREAVIELIDLLNQLDQVEEAMKWVAVAERDGLFPAKTAFLKGLLLTKQRRFDEAVVAFEKSKELEKGYTQAADLQIGLAYLQNRKFTKARERFQASITQDPLSDLASYARRYQDIVEEQSFLQRPLRITLGVSGQYDTNMLQEPATFPGLPDSGEERTMLLNSSLPFGLRPHPPGELALQRLRGRRQQTS